MSTSTAKGKEAEDTSSPQTSSTTINSNATTKNAYAPSRSIKTFDGQNYPVWAIHMQDILRECKLLKYLDKTITDYNEEEDLQTLAEIRFMLSDNQV
jgi:hypothetical protein